MNTEINSQINPQLSPEQYTKHRLQEMKSSIARSSEMAKERQPIPAHIYLEHVNFLTDLLLEKSR